MRWLDWTDLYLFTVMTFIQLVGLMQSRRMATVVANGIARIASILPSNKRRLSETRMARCLDTFTASERRQVLQGTYRTFWQDAFTLALPIPKVNDPAGLARVSGLEHLQQAFAMGRGAILLESSFFGRRNYSKSILRAYGIAISQVHALDHFAGFRTVGETRSRKDVIRPFFEAGELRFVHEIIYLSRGGTSLAFTKRFLKVLGENRVLCISGEGRIGQKSVRLSFLGEECDFVTGAISLAKYSGAPILPFFCWRDADDELNLVVEPPLDLKDGSTGAENGIAEYVRLLESYVLRYPFEYCGWQGQT